MSAPPAAGVPEKSGLGRSAFVDAVTRRGIYYGWVIVAVGFVCQNISAITLQGLGTYVVPLQKEFGWSNTSIGLARSAQQFESMLGPFSGTLVDRFGPRVMMIAGVMLFSISFVIFGSMDSIWGYYAASAVMSVANSCLGLLIVGNAISHWFHAKRTRAMGVAVMGFGFAGVAIVPLMVWAQNAYGWRPAAYGTALGILLIGLPLVLFMRDSPEKYGLLPDGVKEGGDTKSGARRPAAQVNFTVRETFRTRSYWFMTLGAATAMMAQSGVMLYQFAHMEAVLHNRDTAALIIVIMNVFNMAGRLLGGFLGDRYPKHIVLGFDVLFTAVSIVVLGLTDSVAVLFGYAVVFGLAWGVRTPVMSSLTADYFGRTALGKIAGTTQMVSLPLAIMGPLAAGWIADQTGSYASAFLLFGVLAFIPSVLYFLATRPAKPEAQAAAV